MQKPKGIFVYYDFLKEPGMNSNKALLLSLIVMSVYGNNESDYCSYSLNDFVNILQIKKSTVQNAISFLDLNDYIMQIPNICKQGYKANSYCLTDKTVNLINNKGVFVSIELLEIEDMNTNKALLLSQLIFLSNNSDCCFPSHKYLCDLLNTSLRTIMRNLESLKNEGYIKIEENFRSGTNERKSNSYILTDKAKRLKYEVNQYEDIFTLITKIQGS